jgi:hypothetical protein
MYQYAYSNKQTIQVLVFVLLLLDSRSCEEFCRGNSYNNAHYNRGSNHRSYFKHSMVEDPWKDLAAKLSLPQDEPSAAIEVINSEEKNSEFLSPNGDLGLLTSQDEFVIEIARKREQLAETAFNIADNK